MDSEQLFDALQDALVKIVHKIEDGTYEPERENRLFTYAYVFAMNEIRHRTQRKAPPLPIDPKILEREIEDVDSGEFYQLGPRLLAVWPQLSWRHRTVLAELARGMSQEAVGKKWGLGSKTNVGFIRARAARTVRTIMTQISVSDPKTELSPELKREVAKLSDAEIVILVEMYVNEAWPMGYDSRPR